MPLPVGDLACQRRRVLCASSQSQAAPPSREQTLIFPSRFLRPLSSYSFFWPIGHYRRQYIVRDDSAATHSNSLQA